MITEILLMTTFILSEIANPCDDAAIENGLYLMSTNASAVFEV
jgi:hypothetical protein